MKSNSITLVARFGLMVLFAVPAQLSAQNVAGQRIHHHYKLIDIGTFGGPSSYLSVPLPTNVMNKNGAFAGWADTPLADPFAAFCFNPDCFVSHALKWDSGVSIDLGSLAEKWSSAAYWINDAGETVGVSQNGVIDPLIGFPEQRAVVWRDGHIIDLGTFGGNQSNVGQINDKGQVAGFALSNVPDPFSFYYQAFFCQTPLQVCPANATATRAFVWDEKHGMQDLGTLGGPDALAFLVNDHGQVAGFSYTNSTVNPTTGFPTFHPFLWEKGKGMKDLGTLGGTVAQAVNGLNDHGQVVGSTTMAGDQTHHPFLWDGTRLIDLGTFGGDNGEADWINDAGEVVGIAQPTTCPSGSNARGGHAFLWRHGRLHALGATAGLDNSEAVYINSSGQAVGYSFNCDLSAFDATLWENGSIADLNALIPSNSGLYVWTAEFISDKGEIAALGLLSNGDQHAVMLIPCDENHPGLEGCDYGMVEASVTASVAAGSVPAIQREASGRVPFAALWRHNRGFHFSAVGLKN